MELIQLIEAEHRQVERLFERFERAVREGDEAQQASVARDVRRALSVHAAVEEQVLYPALERAGLPAERLDALEDHHAVKLALAELRALTPADERFAAKLRLVARTTRLHVEEEESKLLPHLRETLAPEELQRLGAEFEALRRSAPTRPHPASPDSPPANLVTNAAASVLDRLLDTIEDARGLVRATAGRLATRAVQAGREAADRTRRNGFGLAAQARAAGERALARTRVLGVEVLEGAAEGGQEVASRIEERAAVASRELGAARQSSPRRRAGSRQRSAARARTPARKASRSRR